MVSAASTSSCQLSTIRDSERERERLRERERERPKNPKAGSSLSLLSLSTLSGKKSTQNGSQKQEVIYSRPAIVYCLIFSQPLLLLLLLFLSIVIVVVAHSVSSAFFFCLVLFCFLCVCFVSFISIVNNFCIWPVASSKNFSTNEHCSLATRPPSPPPVSLPLAPLSRSLSPF